MFDRFKIAALSTLLFLGTAEIQSAEVVSSEAPLIDFRSRFVPMAADGNMVVGPERFASEAGLTMLSQGGNAVDAAVATGFALAVTLPRAGNIGGGGFMLVHLAAENRNVFIDYREMAPAAATRDMFLTPEGKVDKRRAYFSHQASGVPGTVAGLIHALEEYGTLPLATVIQPAIDLAANGFVMDITLHQNISARAERLAQDPETKKIFLGNDGKAPAIGSLFKQPDLAATLQRIADNGRDGFYAGPTAELIAKDMAANDGLITQEDLANYVAVERAPVTGQFKDYAIVSAPPPSSGGIHVIQMLNILEPYPLATWGHNSAQYLHHVIEAMKLAYADRSEHLGDPERMEAPIDFLLAKDYAGKRRGLINSDSATPSAEIAPGVMPTPESPDTTHYSVADSAGNVVSNTYTLNFSFGSHITIPGTGILMNNEMDDFAARPGFPNAYGLVQGEKNAVAPGRRPLSSMTPTLVFRNGEPWLATGSPGGSLIITAVMQTILNAMAFDMNIAEAAAAPRVHHQWMPDRVLIEPGISQDTLNILEGMGHNIESTRRTLGRTNSIQLDGPWRYGYSDLRRPGGHVAR
ncbi:gamma-glutamyltransferase [Luminiphilus sp. nBUS_07]|uniref:gamma-glutamyltransferase n=1 Tax=Luminiphilus sp. nBUS_07 TaxID=3395314 RepID=UPI003EB7A4BC